MPALAFACAIAAALATGGVAGFFVASRRAAGETRERRQIEKSYRAMAEDGSDIIALHENGKIVFTSAAMYRLLKRTPAEFENGNYLDIVHPDDLPAAQSLLGTPPPGACWRASYRVRHADGHYVWFEVTTRAVYDDAGNFVREISVGRDITDRKQQKDETRAAQQRAEAANHAKSLFLATMSHELRTPLNAVIGFSEILKSEMFGPVGQVRYRDYAESIHSSGKHLLSVINDILDMTKLDTDQLELAVEPVAIRQTVQECFTYIAPLAEQAGVRLETNLPALTLDADPMRLKQILFNLLSNAVKFSRAGAVVRVEACACADSVAIAISDAGIGMRPEDIPRALERFGQIDNSLSRRYEGVGLGLPLTKQLVELHGGRLEIESAEGAGTTVTVVFPRHRMARAVA